MEVLEFLEKHWAVSGALLTAAGALIAFWYQGKRNTEDIADLEEALEANSKNDKNVTQEITEMRHSIDNLTTAVKAILEHLKLPKMLK